VDEVIVVAIAAGVAVGIMAVTVAVATRRSGEHEAPERQIVDRRTGRSFTFSRTFSAGGSTRPPTSEPSFVEESPSIAETLGQLANIMGADVDAITTRVSRTAVRLDGETPTIEVDGIAYQRLADVPPDARELLRDELQVALDRGMPEPARSRLQTLLATADGPGEATTSPPTRSPPTSD
jgi:hypothetical protein